MKKLLVVLMVLAFVTPAMAADWNMYGSARVGFFYNTYDEDASNVDDAAGKFEDDTDLDMALQGNSRIGANVKASDAVTGRFEYGTGVNVRLLYGTWNFGGGSLTVGQDYTPIDSLYSNQVIDDDIGLLEEGCVYESRLPQIKIKVGGFQAALVRNKAIGTDTANAQGKDLDVILPKIELAYDMTMDMFSIGGFVGYQTYTDGETDADWDVVSYVAGVRSKINFGPAYVNVVLSYAQNAGNYGLLLRNEYAGSQSVNGTDTEDAKTIAAALVVGAKFTDMVAIEAGVGYLKNEVDDAAGGDTTTGDAMTYYVQLPLTLAPGVFIIPEVSIFDLGEDDDGTTKTENGQRMAYGAKFQINF